MHLITLTLGLMLLQTGYALRCYVCDLEGGITCTDQIKNCPNSSDKCVATTIRAYVEHRQVDGTGKKCVPDDKCANGSLGIKGAIVFSQCCITDLCNAIKPPVNATPNGLKCYACDDSNYCSHIVSCVADQDHCFSKSNTETDSEGKVENHVGCISKSICDHDGDDSCCEGDFQAKRPGSTAVTPNADFRAKSSGSTAVTPNADFRAKSSGSTAVTPNADFRAKSSGSTAVTPNADSRAKSSGSTAVTPNADFRAKSSGTTAVTPNADFRAKSSGSTAVTPNADFRAKRSGSTAVTPIITAILASLLLVL